MTKKFSYLTSSLRLCYNHLPYKIQENRALGVISGSARLPGLVLIKYWQNWLSPTLRTLAELLQVPKLGPVLWWRPTEPQCLVKLILEITLYQEKLAASLDLVCLSDRINIHAMFNTEFDEMTYYTPNCPDVRFSAPDGSDPSAGQTIHVDFRWPNRRRGSAW